MSADSQRRSALSSSAVRCMPAIVPPQAVSDRSIIDSVAGFINDVALQQVPQGDAKDHILWARFESAADISDPCLGDDWELEGNVAPPLLLILGYGTGIQVWIIPANGEAIEVLSWRNGNVKCLRVLPTPTKGDGEMANELNDMYVHKRPLIALCDSSTSGPTGGQYCSINFISLKDGDNVKSIKFKNPIVDILANKSSIVVTFPERIAVFDARTLEDRLTVTTCFLSPGLNQNPVALGPRWIAYAEKKMLPSKRSSGGCDGENEKSYTATVLSAAKSLGKGLRELGEQMAAGLTGSSAGSSVTTTPVNLNDGSQGGIVTVFDIKHPIKDISPTTGTPVSSCGSDPIIAHFVAHSEAIVALSFDSSGMLLMTADKRGHDFHIFRIHPHPSGPSLAAVHHLYVLHRGDTTAKVQDITFSLDSRWVAVSTLRGTTHVFPVTPYGGPAGIRTHGSPHVVNRLSRFHRSAGLSIDGRSSSPVSYSENYASTLTPTSAYVNPRVPPFPHPTVVQPLAQLRQPASLGNQGGAQPQQKNAHTTRQRHSSSSSSDEQAKPLRVCATFAKARSWLLDPPGTARDTPAHRIQRKPVDSLFIMAAHGALIQYDLDPKHVSAVPKEKICDDTPIELEVEAKAQWYLQRQDNTSQLDIQPPLPIDNWLIRDRFLDDADMNDSMRIGSNDHRGSSSSISDHDDRWLAQVEIITHAGPHRRLWMGPQFMFKIYNTPSGSPLSSIDIESVEIGTARPARSNPMNMPLSTGIRPLVPVLIESGSCSSYEQSPRLMNEFKNSEQLDTESTSLGPVESQLREDLADAMRESPLMPNRDATGYAPTTTGLSSISSCSSAFSSTHSLNSEKPLTHQSTRPTPMLTIQKVVNPLGTVTTITKSAENEFTDMSESAKKECDLYLHENCDEALFRPVVTVHGSQQMDEEFESLNNFTEDLSEENAASLMNAELIVPVIEEKNLQYFNKNYNRKKMETAACENLAKFEELSSINKKSKKTKFSEHEVTEKIVENEEIVNIEIVEGKLESKKMETVELLNVKIVKNKETPPENRKNDKTVNKKKEIYMENRKKAKENQLVSDISVKNMENKKKIEEIVVEKCKKKAENECFLEKSQDLTKSKKKADVEEISIVKRTEIKEMSTKSKIKPEIDEISMIKSAEIEEIPSKSKKKAENEEISLDIGTEFEEISSKNTKTVDIEELSLIKSVEIDKISVKSKKTANIEEGSVIKSAEIEKTSKKSKKNQDFEDISMEKSTEKVLEIMEMSTKDNKRDEIERPKNNGKHDKLNENLEFVDFISVESTEKIISDDNFEEIPHEDLKNKTNNLKKGRKNKTNDKEWPKNSRNYENIEFVDISAENTKQIIAEDIFVEIPQEDQENKTYDLEKYPKNMKFNKNIEFVDISTDKIIMEDTFLEMLQEDVTNKTKKEPKNIKKNNKKYNKNNFDYEADIMADLQEIEDILPPLEEVKIDDSELFTEIEVKPETIFEVKSDESYEIDFPEPELPPLESFCTKTLDDLSFDDCSSNDCTNNYEKDDKISIIMAELKKKNMFDEKKFVFAMCSSLKEASFHEDAEENLEESNPKIEKSHSTEGQDSDYKSLELDIQDYPINDKNLSEEETESSSSNGNINNDIPSSDDNQQEQEDDEELQPLIRRESFHTRNDSRYDECSSMAAAIEPPSQQQPPLTSFDLCGGDDDSPPSAKAMLNTLPDNQSDNSNKCVNVKQIINNNKKKSKKKRK